MRLVGFGCLVSLVASGTSPNRCQKCFFTECQKVVPDLATLHRSDEWSASSDVVGENASRDPECAVMEPDF